MPQCACRPQNAASRPTPRRLWRVSRSIVNGAVPDLHVDPHSSGRSARIAESFFARPSMQREAAPATAVTHPATTPHTLLTPTTAARMIDHTLLRPEATRDHIQK